MEAPPPATGPEVDAKPTLSSPAPNETVVDSNLTGGNSTLDAKTATLKIADSKMDPITANQDAFKANGEILVNLNGHAEQNGDATMTNGVTTGKQPDQPTSEAAPPKEQAKDTPAQSSTPEASAAQEEKDVPVKSSPGEVTPAPTESSAPKSEPIKTPEGAPTNNGVALPEEAAMSAEPEVKPPSATSDAPAASKALASPIGSPSHTQQTEQTGSTAAAESAEKPVVAPAVPQLAPDQAQGDHEMADAPPLSPTKISREREEDTGDEPAAKRAKTGESQGDEQSKVPELPQAETPTKPEAPSGTDASAITPLRKKFLVRTLQSLKRHPKGRLFKDPVNWAAMNIPTYPNIIKQPMDLSTMEKKLKADQYPKMDDLHADMQLMIYNTTTFNGPEHTVTLEGVALQQHFQDLLAKLPSPDEVELTPAQKKAGRKPAVPKTQPQREARAPAPKKGGPPAATPKTFALGPAGMPVIRRDNADGRPKRSIHPPKNRDFPYNIKPKKKKFVWELKFCKEVLDELHKAKYFHFASPFYQPVDPVALNIPTYHSIIKKPMDLQTMRQKLDAGSYENSREFHADMQLMFKNCYKFNIPHDPVYNAGKELQNIFEQKWSQKARWLEAHEPPSARHSSDEESDEENESDEDQETLTELQRQIAEMSKQVAAIKQKKKTPPAAAKKGAKAKGRGDAKKAAPKKDKKAKNRNQDKWITYQEKQLISNGIASLSEKRMHDALEIIQKNVPHLRNTDQTEIELDMDELPNEVLNMLLTFVKKHAPGPLEFDDEPVPEAMPVMGPAKPKKNKPMTKQEQESRIHALQRNLESFAGGGVISDEAPESSDDEEDSEESEEE